MNPASEVSVTLEPELFERLKAEAKQLGVPLEWVVAALVADTFECSPVPAGV
jgi:hypothetical protein